MYTMLTLIKREMKWLYSLETSEQEKLPRDKVLQNNKMVNFPRRQNNP